MIYCFRAGGWSSKVWVSFFKQKISLTNSQQEIKLAMTGEVGESKKIKERQDKKADSLGIGTNSPKQTAQHKTANNKTSIVQHWYTAQVTTVEKKTNNWTWIHLIHFQGRIRDGLFRQIQSFFFVFVFFFRLECSSKLEMMSFLCRLALLIVAKGRLLPISQNHV